ncbi:DnaJ domain-containing protein [Anaeromyxobacter paludicola]|uniref:J domain-containing protein n=1 Tax=Anaeromyxobacter paludicola TaxID=2918171 RepID=A0ABM7XC78_9BACT|nr:DnaJ domain-containing protein [Anaeromyxobacter paludicola]BDG09478.1 hypothetical protein AMPC_25910 [Anaeromyxobacter paludicola]
MSSKPPPPPPGPPPVLERSTEAPDPAGSAAGAAPSFGAAVSPAAALAAALPWEGSLAEASALHLCYLAAAAQASGRLRLAVGRAQVALVFRRGNVEHAVSTDPADDLGAFLVRRGVVRREAVEAARSGPAGVHADLVGALAAARWLDPAASFPLLQEHGISVVARAVGLEQGAARFEPGVAPPPSSFQLGPRWAVLCSAARRIDPAAARRLLGPRIDRAAGRSGGRVELQSLALTAQEARIAGLFDGRLSPAELAAAHPADAELVIRVALLLAETELLTFGAARPPVASATAPAPASAASRPPPASPASSAVAARPPPAAPAPSADAARPPPAAPERSPSPPGGEGKGGAASPALRPGSTPGPVTPASSPAPGPAKPAATPPPPRASAPASPPRRAESVPELQAVLARLAKADHFEALGVKPDAPTAQIKVAYFKLAKRYHPDAAAPGEPAEARQLRADVFARVGEAWGVLGDEAKRAAYVERQKAGAAEVDVMAILQAENLFQTATVLVRNRKYEEASAKLDEAIALNAKEPEFQVWKAWVEFLLAPDKRRQREVSTAVMEAALKKAPMCMPGYLFMGQMAKLTGDAVAAERCYKRGLAQDPDQTDLQRELKYLRK